MTQAIAKRQKEYTQEKLSVPDEIVGGIANFVTVLKPKPKRNIQAHILDFDVTTDSVVATVTIRTDGIMRRIVVDWGDGKVDTLVNRPGTHVAAFPPVEPLPPGTYRFHHAYAEPPDRKPFDAFVFVRVEDAAGPDFRGRLFTLTPRYRVKNFRTSVHLESGADTIFESSNEFTITQAVDGVPVNQWQWNPSNNIFPDHIFRLEGSIVSRELTVADPFVNVVLAFVESDFLFDDKFSINQSFSGTSISERVVRKTSDGAVIVAQWDREVQLLVPLPSQGPTLENAPG